MSISAAVDELDRQADNFLKVNERKKVVIIYGNCHTTAVANYLVQSAEFTSEYAIFPLKAIQDIKNREYLNGKIFAVCDVFIHQSIRLNNRYGAEFASENMMRKLKKDCRIIAIPNVYHLPMCLFPQYSDKPEFRGLKGDGVFFRDLLLDQLFSEGVSVKGALNKYLCQTDGIAANIEEQFKCFIEKVQKREAEWDIKISPFILKYYKHELLFFDPNHPTPFVIRWMGKEVLRQLKITIKSDADIVDMRLDTYQMPICGAVIAALDLSYGNEELRKTGRKLENKKMFLADYIKQYYSLEWQNKELPLRRRLQSFAMFCKIEFDKFIRKNAR